MKILNTNSNGNLIEMARAEKFIKTDKDIYGYDANNNVVASLKGISDMSLFSVTMEDGTPTTFDVEENLEETTVKEVANLKLDLMKKNTIITGALKSIADLKIEIINLKGAN